MEPILPAHRGGYLHRLVPGEADPGPPAKAGWPGTERPDADDHPGYADLLRRDHIRAKCCNNYLLRCIEYMAYRTAAFCLEQDVRGRTSEGKIEAEGRR